jgi:hypothetical protein
MSVCRRSICRIFVFVFVSSLICCKSPTTEDKVDLNGNWSGVKAGTSTTSGSGISFTVSGQNTISNLLFTTENYFGIGIGGPPPGCLLAFEATGPAAISANSFSADLTLGSTPVAGVSSLSVSVGASFSVAARLTGTFSGSDTFSSNACSGQVTYSIESCSCGNRTYSGGGSGFGTNTRTWSASKK